MRGCAIGRRIAIERLDKLCHPTEYVPPSRIKEEAAMVVKSLWRAGGGGIPAGITAGGHTVRAPFITSEAARSRGETLPELRVSSALPMSSTV
jgi:hypothetical protein